MDEREVAPNDDALSKLVEATNSFHIDDDIASKFKSPPPKHPKFTPNDLIRKMAATEPNCSLCARDVHFLIKFYLHSTSARRYDVTSEGHNYCLNLMKKYGVQRKADADNITLHRIAASFPIVAVTILRQHEIDRIFTSVMLAKKGAGEFPWSMRTQMSLSLVPIGGDPTIDDEDRSNVLFAIIAYMCYENKVVNEGKRGVWLGDIFAKVLNIAYTIHAESHVAEKTKKPAWNHILFDYNERRGSVNGLLNHFRREIPDAEAAFKRRFGFRVGNTEQGVLNGRKTQYMVQNARHWRKTQNPEQGVQNDRKTQNPEQDAQNDRKTQNPQQDVQNDRKTQNSKQDAQNDRNTQNPEQGVQNDRKTQNLQQGVQNDRQTQNSEQDVQNDRKPQNPQQGVQNDRKTQNPEQDVQNDRKTQNPEQYVKNDRKPQNPQQGVQNDRKTQNPDQDVQNDRKTKNSKQDAQNDRNNQNPEQEIRKNGKPKHTKYYRNNKNPKQSHRNNEEPKQDTRKNEKPKQHSRNNKKSERSARNNQELEFR